METWMIFFGLRKRARIRIAAAIREMSVGIAAPATPIFRPKIRIEFPTRLMPFMNSAVNIAVRESPIARNRAAPVLYSAINGIEAATIIR